MDLNDADWSLIPDHMHGALRRYIEDGLPPGDFLTAVLCNDLRAACQRADSINQHLLFNYVKFLYLDAPGNCWGSRELFNAWIEHQGLNGLYKEMASSLTQGDA